VAGRSPVIYCSSCGALNPATNHYCSACAHQLVDAYHPSEGLRIYSAPDPGAPLVDIVGPGMEIAPVDIGETLPGDFVRVTLSDGRTGYIRLHEIDFPEARESKSSANGKRPLGGQSCINSWAVLAVLALLVVTGLLAMIIALQSRDAGNDFLAILACFTVVPFFLQVVGFYLAVRSREEGQAERD
jgi:hypothetical protein